MKGHLVMIVQRKPLSKWGETFGRASETFGDVHVVLETATSFICDRFHCMHE
jgi:hypothetical protein